jgi:glucose-6-phosphate isomerase
MEALPDRAWHEKVVRGIWAKDPSAWTDRPEQLKSIPQWLGWLEVATQMRPHIGELTAFVDDVRRAGYTHALLLGMGGSSLAPEVMRLTNGVAPGYLDLAVLDSTDPATVLHYQRRLPVGKTLFIVSTKSGTTTETVSFQRFFFEHVRQSAGESAGDSFIAITDPGTPLEQLARDQHFRRTFLNPEDIGGRFSALSYFGLVPAALMGIDLDRLLRCAEMAMDTCRPETAIDQNLGFHLGVTLAQHHAAGRNKVTLVCPTPFESFGYWVEQLLAESTGKEGKGLVPVEGETLGLPEVYGQDRVFVSLADGGTSAPPLFTLEQQGQPVTYLPAGESCDLGYLFFLWEFATAVAGAYMGIDAFDQPNVQESKDYTNQVLREFEMAGRLPSVPELLVGDTGGDRVQLVKALLDSVKPGDYVALLAYLPRTLENEAALQDWRLAIRDQLEVATTVGFGPRFLHSTGQLHKGGPNNGVFIQLVSDDPQDAPIPGAPYTFGTLKQAQAIGDLQALQAHGRRVQRVRLMGNPTGAIDALAAATCPQP